MSEALFSITNFIKTCFFSIRISFFPIFFECFNDHNMISSNVLSPVRVSLLFSPYSFTCVHINTLANKRVDTTKFYYECVKISMFNDWIRGNCTTHWWKMCPTDDSLLTDLSFFHSLLFPVVQNEASNIHKLRRYTLKRGLFWAIVWCDEGLFTLLSSSLMWKWMGGFSRGEGKLWN